MLRETWVMREDLLLSIAVIEPRWSARHVERLRSIGDQLRASFRYFEIMCVVDDRDREQVDACHEALEAIPNLRIIFVGRGTSIYRMRHIAAMQAIGDVLMLYDPDELTIAEALDPISDASDQQRVLVGWRKRSRIARLGFTLLRFLSRHEIDARTARSIILPRDRLDVLLGRPSVALDLRFPPRSGAFTYGKFPVGAGGSERVIDHRAELLFEILLSGAPRYLKAYAFLGFFVTLAALAYALYATAMLFTRSDLAEGWFSTAITQAGSTAFIALGMSLISIAVVAFLDRSGAGAREMLLDERSNADFGGLHNLLNVELSDQGGDEPGA